MENKIKILHVVQSAGGVERYLQMLLKYMNRNRFENILVCSQDYTQEDYKNLVDVFEQIEMNREIGKSDIKAIKQVRKLIKKYKPDIVYAHSSKAGAITRIANIGLSSRCIYNPHGWSFNMRCSEKKKKMYIAIEKLAAPFCEKIVCISDAEKKSALNYKICKEEKLKVIFNGVDIEKYKNRKHGVIRRNDLNIPLDAFVVGMVGRISEQKAPDIFIRAAKLVKKEIPNAYFIIVGSDEQENDIKNYAKANGLYDCLCITGWVSNPVDYMELFDIACLLSRWEGFGLVLAEYMMVGKPIIATNVDAIPNIITDGENGVLVDLDNPEEVKKAVLQIYNDKNFRTKLITKGQKVLKKFDVQRVATEHQNMFAEIANNQ